MKQKKVTKKFKRFSFLRNDFHKFFSYIHQPMAQGNQINVFSISNQSGEKIKIDKRIPN